MRNEENPRAGGSETGDACGQKVAGVLKKSRHPQKYLLRPFSQTISRQHLHPGKEPPAVGKAYFTIESAKHSH